MSIAKNASYINSVMKSPSSYNISKGTNLEQEKENSKFNINEKKPLGCDSVSFTQRENIKKSNEIANNKGSWVEKISKELQTPTRTQSFRSKISAEKELEKEKGFKKNHAQKDRMTNCPIVVARNKYRRNLKKNKAFAAMKKEKSQKQNIGIFRL